jgi:hypothetical protein
LLGSERAPLPRVEEGRAVALPLDKLGTSYPPGTVVVAGADGAGAPITPTVDGGGMYVLEATSKGASNAAMVVKNGPAEVV